MIATARFCDLCKCDGELTLASHKYRSDLGWSDACEDHAEEVKRYELTTVPYQHLGDIDPDNFR